MHIEDLIRQTVSALVFGGVALAAAPALAQSDEAPFLTETSATAAIIVDGETGAVLLEKEADAPFPPASLAKLMTMEVVFQALKSGELSPSTPYRISEHAWRTGGAPSGTSTMFAEVRSSVPVDALVRGVIVHSANDAAIALAEGMAGSEAAFAADMNERAAELGLDDSRFVNPTGLPAEGQLVTARDLVALARHMEATYPELYRIYAQPDFAWNDITQRNRNPLLGLDIGATGMGTGFTEGVGYALVGVTDEGGRKTFIALGGLESEAERVKETERLLAWAGSQFRRETLFSAGESVGSASVFAGVVADVPLVLADDLVAYVPNEHPEAVTAAFSYQGPLIAPIAKGDPVGRIDIRIGERLSVSQDLLAGEDVARGNFASRAFDAVQELAFGWVRLL